MVASGYLSHDPAAQTYALSEEHAYFLASDDTDHFVGGLFAMVPPLLRVAPQVVKAFSRGRRRPFEHFGPDCVSALDLINRGQYETRLADYWLKSLPDAAARLAAGGRALDVGCGSGAVCGALAKAFPKARDHRHRSGRGIHRQARSEHFPKGKFLGHHCRLSSAARAST